MNQVGKGIFCFYTWLLVKPVCLASMVFSESFGYLWKIQNAN